METNIEKGTYDIIQARLQQQRSSLVENLQKLNQERQQIFGAVEFKLLSNVRINTQHNCIARDIVSIGDACLFGYNVRLGLKTVLEVGDVFSVYRFSDHEFHPMSLELIQDKSFADELQNLYKFYRHTQFSRFFVQGSFLYMVFQLSDSPTDIKAFKWLIEENKLQFVDSRSAAEVKFPLQYEFEWIRATRDMQRTGKNPHISIVDKVFVETTKGNLTIKVEDNTDDGLGIYSEDVLHSDQSLDDGEIHFCDLGNLVLLKIKPYLESERYFIFNHRVKNVVRVDTLKDAGILLPDDQGILLSNGYYLQTGENKIFDRKIEGVKFLRKIQSPNGEDYLFIFYEEKNHDFVILSYNVIEQTVKTPIFCNGYTLFTEGELCYFNTEKEPGKHHNIQVWQTPYTKEILPNEAFKNHELYKIGNRSIVKAMAEVQELIVLLAKEDSYNGLYLDIEKRSQSILDGYFWLRSSQLQALSQALQETKEIALAAIGEFEKVLQIKQHTLSTYTNVKEKVDKVLFETRSSNFESLDQYVSLLSQMRGIRGEIIGLKNLRYIDLEQVELLEVGVAKRAEELSQACVQFLLQDNALDYYKVKMDFLTNDVSKLEKVIDAKSLEKSFDQLSKELELLIEIVNNLNVEDTAHATQIIESISLIFAQLNQQRVALNNRRKQIGEREARADFQAQMTLFEQSIVNFLELANDTAKCDEYLSKLSIQLEELEGRFVDFDDFIDKISEKRESVYAAFESKKGNLTEARNKRTNSLFASATRILNSIKSRAATFGTEVEINGYFASDLMIDKVRDVASQLQSLGDSAKSEDLLNQLQVLQQEAIRALKDKNELFEDGNQVIKLGEYRFAVNQQKLDLTMLVKNNTYHFHLTGTSYYEAVHAPEMEELKDVWDQELPSENRTVHRTEYLAWQVFQSLDKNKVWIDSDLANQIAQYTATHYGEGYVKGVHDQDALLILQALLEKERDLGLLRFESTTRALAQLFWYFLPEDQKVFFKKQFIFINLIKQAFAHTKEIEHLLHTLSTEISQFKNTYQLFSDVNSYQASIYLSEQQANDSFIMEAQANELLIAFKKSLKEKNLDISFAEAQQELKAFPAAIWHLSNHWIKTYISTLQVEFPRSIVEEATAFIITGAYHGQDIHHVSGKVRLEGLKTAIGSQETDSVVYDFDYHDFHRRLRYFSDQVRPRFQQLQELKHHLILEKKKALRLHEFQTQVLTSFVRNKLINQVYFPLIGQNFSKQLGVSGQDKRTDRSGMLLLISPPGYGKTTLMEYVADRLGLIFMKINGPSIGHEITSVDPAEAKNAATRQELQKLNLAFEMRDNVMLYLDDIQHCNPEFLQKFISLADGQRKIEGVYNGVSKTYDFRGKRFCIVMAGNPYTESGEKFQIPDMLSNRADIYNLGDTASNRVDLFKLSLIENGLTSNMYLKSITQYGLENLYKLVEFIENGEQQLPDLEGNITSMEIQDCIQVLQKTMKIRDVVLKVNAAYIASAAMADDYREEPPFKLQGSYRDMNKLMGQIVPILNEKEVTQLLLDHYQNESQTLTSDAESNLLKLAEMMNMLDPIKKERWDAIKATFVRNNRVRGFGDNDRMSQIIGQMNLFVEGLEGIKQVLDYRNSKKQ
ncbi:DNA repair ATPase [Mongoliitalea daihaiensis]|uniref:DNA repair ATPase n=1 Tax=Mongoliitalea daihaiensis TaxID=2782006 RepID=UPI001F267B18|nr:DNA repair ATPase [Mongoliitalea daihaiensis]UJP66062.1 DNA repair ATPase [Mongoliitalea daihaiensis]